MNEHPRPLDYAILFIPICLRALNAMLFKYAALSMDHFSFLAAITNVLYLVCFVLLFARAVTWQFAIRRIPLSVAYPISCISFVLILVLSYFFFDETITPFNLMGSALIILGAILLTQRQNGSPNAE